MSSSTRTPSGGVEPDRSYPRTPLLGASACIWHEDKVLLVLGAVPPKQNLWSLPGGLVEVGETLQQAAERELVEETGLTANILGLAEWVEIIEREEASVKYHFVVAMFAGCFKSGSLAAGDDAREARWFSLQELCQLKMTKGTKDLIHMIHAGWMGKNA